MEREIGSPDRFSPSRAAIRPADHCGVRAAFGRCCIDHRRLSTSSSSWARSFAELVRGFGFVQTSSLQCALHANL